MSTVAKIKSLEGPSKYDRKRRRSIQCKECEYESERSYNVVRHAERIHSKPKQKIIKCKKCDTEFANKGDFYLHSENIHPGLRKSSYTSRIKYGILGEVPSLDSPIYDNDNKKLQLRELDECWISGRERRSSERLRQKATREFKEIINANIKRAKSIPDIENIPLSYFVQEEGLITYLKKLPSPGINEDERNIKDVNSVVIPSKSEKIKNEVKNEYVHLPIKKRIVAKFRESSKENKNPLLNYSNGIVGIDSDVASIMHRHREFLNKFDFDQLKTPLNYKECMHRC